MSKWIFLLATVFLISSSFRKGRPNDFTTFAEIFLEAKKNLMDTLPVKDSVLEKKSGTLSSDTLIFMKVETPPSVDQKQWVQHLQKNLTPFIESAAANNMPVGTYKVIVRFLVEKDGSVTDVHVLNDPGYGLKEASIKMVETGPKWKPGIANGKNVRCYHTQPITYVISEG
jgi:protein TonB